MKIEKEKLKRGKRIMFGLFVMMVFVMFILGMVERVRGENSNSNIYWDETKGEPTLDKINKETGKENPVANEQQIRESPDFGIENYNKANPDQQSWTISEKYGVNIKDTSGSTLDNNILTMKNGVKIDLANTQAGTSFEISGDFVKMTTPDGKSEFLTNIDGEIIRSPSPSDNSALSGCGSITGGVISIDSITGKTIAPITGFAAGCPSGGESDDGSGGGGGRGSATPKADSAIQAFLGIWSSLAGILSSIGQGIEKGVAKGGGSSSLTSAGSNLVAGYDNGGGIGLDDKVSKDSVTSTTTSTTTATMGSGDSGSSSTSLESGSDSKTETSSSSSSSTNLPATGKAVSTEEISYQYRNGRTAIMEQEDITRPGKTVIKNYNTLGLQEMESENTKMHLFTREGNEVKRLVTLHMPLQKTSIFNDPNGGAPKVSGSARERDMSGTGSGVTGNAISGISGTDQYVDIEDYDMRIGGEKIDVKIYRSFNEIRAKGSLLVVRDADSRFEFNGNRMYYDRIPKENFHFINKISNELDSSNQFSLFPGGQNGNYLIDGKETVTIGDEVVQHPKLKGIYIAREREEMFKKATGK